jgi:hypothetical protein
MIELLLAGGAAFAGFKYTKRFVVRRLRFVPSARKKAAPWVAGAGAALLAVPLVSMLPLLGGLTALAFGAGVAGGVKAGDSEIDRTNVWGDQR